jgi:dTDP-glucose 4,6-dehydratase
MKGRTIFVTGGAGFVGSNFVRRAVGYGTEVITLDALNYAGDPSNLASLEHNPLHIFVHGSINDRTLVSGLLEKHKPQAIVNFAAERRADDSGDTT